MEHIILLFVALFLVGMTFPCRACVALAQDAKGQPVAVPFISGEQAVIIWDEAHKTEHFIRQADISTTQPNVGFVVPTPQTPELVEADPLIFAMVGEEAAPKMVPPTVSRTPVEMLSSLFGMFAVKSVFTTIASQLAVAASGPKGVQVISEQDVADYHATILEAENTASLSQWLKENGYAWNKENDAWLQPYLVAKWKITAFKLLQKPADKNSGRIQSRAIRMSFATDRPFFPYSEPGDAEKGKKPNPGYRVLNVAVLGDKRMTGKLDDGHTWPGKLQYSGPMETPYSASQFVTLAKLDGQKETVTLPTCLTYFVDNSNPRPGTSDLYFSPDTDQTSFRKIIVDPDLPPEYRMDWSNPVADVEALMCVLLPVCVIFGGAWLLQRTQRSKETN